MNLNKRSLLKPAAKAIARPLSRVLCSDLLYGPCRMVDAYLNFLIGKGSGAGWDLNSEVSAALARTYARAPIIFDIGANVGSWSERVCALVPSARIFMFEPSPECRKAIGRKTRLSGATLVPSAVGDLKGKATLHFSSPTDITASLHRRADTFCDKRTYLPVEIDVTTIDSVIEGEKLDFVDFIKMDIEGHELFALQGASTALSARRIGALQFEFGSGNINSRTFFRQFWDLLTAAGFRIWRITSGGHPVLIDEYYEDLEYFRGVSNYVAELKEHPYSHARNALHN